MNSEKVKRMKTFSQAQQDSIKEYRITINECSSCWGRTHAHPKKRMVCKWHPKNSIQSTFDLFHEIGHVVTYHGNMRRCESEYHATVFAIKECEKHGLEIPEKILDKYQRYIWMERDRGLRRHAEGLPSRDDLNIKVVVT